jgi:hypothetical protein
MKATKPCLRIQPRPMFGIVIYIQVVEALKWMPVEAFGGDAYGAQSRSDVK